MNMHNSLRAQLGEVFDTKQADVLANVVTEAYDKLVTKSDLYELRVVVREIADNQKITDEQLAVGQERLFASQEQLTGRIDQLAIGQEKLTGRMEQLAIDQDELVGPVYEGKVAAHLNAYVGDTVDHYVVLDSRGKARFFANLDPNGLLDRSEVSDLRRAAILAKTGTRAIPVVACLRIDFATRALAHEKGVWVIRKGRHLAEAG